MRLIPKQLWKEEFDYVSDKSVDSLKSDIQQLFDKTQGWNFSVNLTGQFVSHDKFTMIPKWQFAIIRGWESEISYLSGQILQDEYKRTLVKFAVRPNSIFAIFFFLFPLFGVFALTSNNINGDKNDAKIVGLVFTLLVPVAMMVFGHFAKKGIKDRFIKTFDLRPIEGS